MKGNQDYDIQHPEAWELLVSIGDKQVDYILFTPTVANSLIIGEMDYTEESLQGLEDAVYNFPVLLKEYKRVRVVVHPRHFLLLPQEASDEDCMMLLREAFPGSDGDAAVCLMSNNGVKVAYLMPRGMQAFLGRTFNYPEVIPHLVPLCEHFKALDGAGDSSTMFLHLTDNCADLAIYSSGALMCANTYPFTSDQDLAYFALSTWRSHGLDQLADEIQLLGDNDRQAMMMPVLREYVKNVKPAVYPAAAMRLGRNAMQAPMDLILLALCE